MSVVVEETENRNSFVGAGETTRREGICTRDAEKERRWSAMNGRITHRGDLEGEGMKLPAAVRWQTGPLPRCCLESATVQGTRHGRMQPAEWQPKKPLPMEEAEGEIDCSCAEKRREEWTA